MRNLVIATVAITTIGLVTDEAWARRYSLSHDQVAHDHQATRLLGAPAVNRAMPPPLRSRPLAKFIEPCLPRLTTEPPAGPGWLHEIKHDGFRIMARRSGGRVRLLTRNGYDFADRFPKIAEAVANLPVRSCLIDGEAIVVDKDGLSVFELLRYRRHDHAALLCAFDLIELDSNDLRSATIEHRKAALAKLLLREAEEGIAFNQHFSCEGAFIYKHACALGCEGIVSKRLGSPYRSGRVDHWLKTKNPAAPAVRREAEEDWNGRRWPR